MLSLQARALLRRPLARSDENERRLGRWRHAHFRPHRPDLGDEIDDPADLGFDRLVDFEALGRPWPERQGPDALGTGFSGDRPKLLGEERHERMQDRVDHVEHMGDRRLRLGLGRRVGAAPCSTGLASSRCQSQKTLQTKR